MSNLEPIYLLHSCMLSPFSRVQIFATLWTIARWAPRSMGFSKQEHLTGLSFPMPGDLPNTRTETVSLVSPELAGFFTTEPPGKSPAR